LLWRPAHERRLCAGLKWLDVLCPPTVRFRRPPFLFTSRIVRRRSAAQLSPFRSCRQSPVNRGKELTCKSYLFIGSPHEGGLFRGSLKIICHYRIATAVENSAYHIISCVISSNNITVTAAIEKSTVTLFFQTWLGGAKTATFDRYPTYGRRHMNSMIYPLLGLRITSDLRVPNMYSTRSLNVNTLISIIYDSTSVQPNIASC
jgi:hypothetical protein